MKNNEKKYLASFVLATYIITLLVASFHYHELNINYNKFHYFEKAKINHSQHFIAQNLCVTQIFLTNDFNLTHDNINFEKKFYNEIKFVVYLNPRLLNTFLHNISLRAPPTS